MSTATPPSTPLHHRHALVTGASRGIGRAIAEAFAAAGARVAIHCRTHRPDVDAFAAALPGGPHPVVAADLADPDAPRRLAEAAERALGGIDVLVNNAGIFVEHPPLETEAEAWDIAWRDILAVNLLAPAHLCHAVARGMAASGGGHIVNVSSRGAFRGEPDAPAYGASKAGLNALSQSLAKALAPNGIVVTAVAPGWVETDMAAPYAEGLVGEDIRRQSPLGRLATPAEIAEAVVFLATAPAALTGAILDANGASYLRT